MEYLDMFKITIVKINLYLYIVLHWGSELVSGCCLKPTQHFSAISWREQVNFQWNDDEFRFVLDQHAELDIHSASSLKQHSAGRHVVPLGHIILILIPDSLNDPIGARTHGLPHSR
jgi:hypothetical protein